MWKRIVLGGLGLIVLIMLIQAGTWVWRYYTAEPKGKVEAKEKTESGDYRIYSYDHFYDLYHKVKSYDKQIKVQKDNLEQAEDEKARRRIRRNISGLKSQRSRVIQKYNSDARKEKTRGKFKPKDLPKKIEPR